MQFCRGQFSWNETFILQSWLPRVFDGLQQRSLLVMVYVLMWIGIKNESEFLWYFSELKWLPNNKNKPWETSKIAFKHEFEISVNSQHSIVVHPYFPRKNDKLSATSFQKVVYFLLIINLPQKWNCNDFSYLIFQAKMMVLWKVFVISLVVPKEESLFGLTKYCWTKGDEAWETTILRLQLKTTWLWEKALAKVRIHPNATFLPWPCGEDSKRTLICF